MFSGEEFNVDSAVGLNGPMVAAQRSNQDCGQPIATIYGSVSSGTTWRFMKLEEQTVTVDFTDYPLPPTDVILGMLLWMIEQD